MKASLKNPKPSLLSSWRIRLQTINWQFVSLLGVLIAVDSRNWSDKVWMASDGTPVMHMFYSFYNELFFHGHLVRWLPYGNFGIQADMWQFLSFTSANYLVAIVGAILRIPNALLLMKLAVFLEQCFLLLGTYCLAKEIFQRKTSTIIVCLLIICTTTWLPQLPWGLRIYYLFPLILYFLVLFFKHQRPHFLWMAGITGVALLLGNIIYYVFIYIPLLSAFFSILWLSFPKTYQCLTEKSRLNLFAFVIFIGVSLIVGYFASHMMGDMVSSSFGRDPITHTTNINEFLISGERGFDKFRNLFFPIVNENFGLPIFFGLMPLVFVFYSLIHVRKPVFVAISFMAFFALILSLGDVAFIARKLYDFFPPIRFFHYLGSLNSLLRLFFILMAGFGIDCFLNVLKNQETVDKRNHIRQLYFCGFFTFSVFLILLFRGSENAPVYSALWIKYHWFIWILFSFAFLVLSKPNLSLRFASRFLVFLIALELFSFQQAAFAAWPYKFSWLDREVTHVHAYQYQPQRLLDINEVRDERTQKIRRLAEEGKQGFLIEMLNYLQVDPCLQRTYPNFYWPKDLNDLFQNRWPLYQNAPNLFVFMEDPHAMEFFDVLGCRIPKIQLFSNPVLVQNRQEMVEWIKNPALNWEGKIIIEGSSISNPKLSAEPNQIAGSVQVARFNFNSIQIKVNVAPEEGAWLYYADSYHPAWKAKIDGQSVPVKRANLAFKSVWVAQGEHVVEFNYFGGIQGLMGYMLVFLGVSFSLILLGKIFLLVFKPIQSYEIY